MKFISIIPVKTYVKRFLENNYGDPVDFSSHPNENIRLKRMLTKPNYHCDTIYDKRSLNSKTLPFVSVLISSAEYYRYGWQLSKTDIARFNKHYELQAKQLMRSVVGNYISFGTPIQAAIEKFQERYHMEEDYWTFEAIKKDFYRFKLTNEIDFKGYAYDHLERLLLKTLINTKSISKQIFENINF